MSGIHRGWQSLLWGFFGLEVSVFFVTLFYSVEEALVFNLSQMWQILGEQIKGVGMHLCNLGRYRDWYVTSLTYKVKMWSAALGESCGFLDKSVGFPELDLDPEEGSWTAHPEESGLACIVNWPQRRARMEKTAGSPYGVEDLLSRNCRQRSPVRGIVSPHQVPQEKKLAFGHLPHPEGPKARCPLCQQCYVQFLLLQSLSLLGPAQARPEKAATRGGDRIRKRKLSLSHQL